MVPGHRLTGKVSSCLVTRIRAGATSPGQNLGPREHWENPGRQRPVHAQVGRSLGCTRDLSTQENALCPGSGFFPGERVTWSLPRASRAQENAVCLESGFFPRRKAELVSAQGEPGCVVAEPEHVVAVGFPRGESSSSAKALVEPTQAPLLDQRRCPLSLAASTACRRRRHR